MRIALVTETWWPSIDGVVTRLTATIRQLRTMGHDLLVIAPEGGAREFEGVPVLGVPTVSVRMIYGGKPWGMPLPRVVRYLDHFRPDVIHALNPFVLGWAAVLGAARRSYPLVASYHTNIAQYADFYHLGLTKPLIWRLVHFLHSHAQVNLATSKQVQRELTEHRITNVYIWRRGVDRDVFHPRYRSRAMRDRLTNGHGDRRIAIFVGRIALEKSLDRLLPMFQRTHNVHLAVVGDGPARAIAEQQFRHTPTTFVGPLLGADLSAAYASADFFVFPSTHDTLGLVLLEAMASGLPIVAADTPVAHELLDESGAGTLFVPEKEGSLAAALNSLLQQDLDALSQRVRREAERWDWHASTQELLAFYAVAQKRARHR